MKTIEEHAGMKERPILFSGPMIRALNEGRKTQTRRLVKPQPPDGASEVLLHARDQNRVDFFNGQTQCLGSVKCPYGQPGDRLWVKETWGQVGEGDPIIYRATCDTETRCATNWYDRGFKWTPSIHMPRWASRITLEITSIRVERLQDISEEDARAEGVEWLPGDGFSWGYAVAPHWDYVHDTAKDAFEELWESINGPGSWDANPWVWVITFKRAGVLA